MAQATPKKTFTKEEVAKHTEPEDLWIILHGRVYNVTPFLEEHPGGDGVLLDNAGRLLLLNQTVTKKKSGLTPVVT